MRSLPAPAQDAQNEGEGCPGSSTASTWLRAARLTETAREAGATDPERLGEQLALLIDGASVRTRVVDREQFSAAAGIAAALIDNAIPASSDGARSTA